ncbi:MAG: 50S ribosomal protein L21 [Candidatus Saccharimonadales bacterium]
MKQAVIETGGKQYLVAKNQEFNIELVEDKKQLSFEPLLVFDDKNDKDVQVGTPTVKGAKVTAKVVEPRVKGEKITIFKFKAKKRVSKKTGHRQNYSTIKITDIKS